MQCHNSLDKEWCMSSGIFVSEYEDLGVQV